MKQIMNHFLIIANVGECLLTQPEEQNFQRDIWSLGLLLIEMLEPDSVFLKPFPSALQRPDSTEPCAVDFLSQTRSHDSNQLQQVCA
jgi:serine/threonine protein kinase